MEAKLASNPPATPDTPDNNNQPPPEIPDTPTINPYGKAEIVSKWETNQVINPEFLTQPPNILNDLAKGADKYRILVPRDNPFAATDRIAREVLLFGDPRIPPPADRISTPAYLWARHSHTVPTTSEERITSIFPRTFDHPLAGELRLSITSSTTYEEIKGAVIAAMNRTGNQHDRIANLVDFLTCNLDHLSPHLLLLAMTHEKMALQSKKLDFSAIQDLRTMVNLAAQRLSFPIFLEQQKAESRVLTYRGLMGGFDAIAQEWDGSEVTLFFAALINGRITYDTKIAVITQYVDSQLAYINDEDMLTNARSEYIRNMLAKPTLTAEVYLNASRVIAQLIPDLYDQVAPEIRALHEVYFLLPKNDYHEQQSLLDLYNAEDVSDDETLLGGQEIFSPSQLAILQEEDRNIKKYFDENFAARSGISTARLVQRLQTMEHLFLCQPELCSVYAPLACMLLRLRQALTTIEEREAQELWFDRFTDANPYETYEPDPMARSDEEGRQVEKTATLPGWLFWQTALESENNEFVQNFKAAFESVIYFSRSFDGSRRKASDPPIGDWMKDDPAHAKGTFVASSRQEAPNEKLRVFAMDYIARVELAVQEVTQGTKTKGKNIHPLVALNARRLQSFLKEEQEREERGEGILESKVEEVFAYQE